MDPSNTVADIGGRAQVSVCTKDRSVLCSTSKTENGSSIECNNLWFQIVYVTLDITDVDLFISLFKHLIKKCHEAMKYFVGYNFPQLLDLSQK